MQRACGKETCARNLTHPSRTTLHPAGLAHVGHSAPPFGWPQHASMLQSARSCAPLPADVSVPVPSLGSLSPPSVKRPGRCECPRVQECTAINYGGPTCLRSSVSVEWCTRVRSLSLSRNASISLSFDMFCKLERNRHDQKNFFFCPFNPMGWARVIFLHVALTALSPCSLSSSLPASNPSHAHVLLIQKQGPEVRIQQMNLLDGESV